MITREDIERLNTIRAERKRLEKLDKELTEELISKADTEEKKWKGLSYKITDGKSTFANKEEIMKLDDWEKYYKTTTYKKLVISTGK